MTMRKPTGTGFESWIDAQIRQARERGDFDHIEGKGSPLPDLDKPYAYGWWARKLVAEEDLTELLPPSLKLKKQVQAWWAGLPRLRTEADVRRAVDVLNRHIRAVNSRPSSGPPSVVAPVDPLVALERWRALKG